MQESNKVTVGKMQYMKLLQGIEAIIINIVFII